MLQGLMHQAAELGVQSTHEHSPLFDARILSFSSTKSTPVGRLEVLLYWSILQTPIHTKNHVRT